MMRGHELDSLSRHDADAEDLRRRLTVVVAALVGTRAPAATRRARTKAER